MKITGRLFKKEMIRALLCGAKTQTRRLVTAENSLIDGNPARSKRAREFWEWFDWRDAWIDSGPSTAGNPGPYWKVPHKEDDTVHRIYPASCEGDILYARERHRRSVPAFKGQETWPIYEADLESAPLPGAWTPGFLMPRKFARIWLELIEVRPERLQDISEADALAEGVARGTVYGSRVEYERLWDSINSQTPWASNPPVWVSVFRRCEPPVAL